MRFFLINDTRYDNHHGCETVVGNLIEGMAVRGWGCAGTLPVGKCRKALKNYAKALDTVDLVVVNGEGSLHHDQSSVAAIMGAVEYCFEKGLPVVLINALWQENSLGRYRHLLEQMSSIYVRDTYSERELGGQGIACKYVPDLTFLSDYASNPEDPLIDIGFTDSVSNSKSAWLYQLSKETENSRFLPALFLDQKHRNHSGVRRAKRWVYPRLHRVFGINVRQGYINMAYGTNDTKQYLERLRGCSVVVAGRYHVLCFCIQNSIPFLIVESNSHKVPALVEEIGLKYEDFLVGEGVTLETVLQRCAEVSNNYTSIRTLISDFNTEAKRAINKMLDEITGFER